MIPGIGHSYFWSTAADVPTTPFIDGNMYVSADGVGAHAMIRLGVVIIGILLCQ